MSKIWGVSPFKDLLLSDQLVPMYPFENRVRHSSAILTLTVSPLTVPISSRIVKTSSSACVGCSPTPSPAFSTGRGQCFAANCAHTSKLQAYTSTKTGLEKNCCEVRWNLSELNERDEHLTSTAPSCGCLMTTTSVYEPIIITVSEMQSHALELAPAFAERSPRRIRKDIWSSI